MHRVGVLGMRDLNAGKKQESWYKRKTWYWLTFSILLEELAQFYKLKVETASGYVHQTPISEQPAGSPGPRTELAYYQRMNTLRSKRKNHTSSSILASAMSCSLPLPPATFWAESIWDLTACIEKSAVSTVWQRISENRYEITYVGAEVLKRETLDSVDAQLRVGLDNGETTGN